MIQFQTGRRWRHEKAAFAGRESISRRSTKTTQEVTNAQQVTLSRQEHHKPKPDHPRGQEKHTESRIIKVIHKAKNPTKTTQVVTKTTWRLKPCRCRWNRLLLPTQLRSMLPPTPYSSCIFVFCCPHLPFMQTDSITIFGLIEKNTHKATNAITYQDHPRSCN